MKIRSLRAALDALREGHEAIIAGQGMPDEVSADAIKRAAAALAGPGDKRPCEVHLTVDDARSIRLALARAENRMLVRGGNFEDHETRAAVVRCQKARTVVEDALAPHGLVPTETPERESDR